MGKHMKEGRVSKYSNWYVAAIRFGADFRNPCTNFQKFRKWLKLSPRDWEEFLQIYV
jgi:hypothetical protein